MTCSVEGCPNQTRARGLCNGHYLRFRRTGDPGSALIGLPRRRTVVPPCVIDGCDGSADGAFGWCRMHYARFRRHGDPLHVGVKRTRRMSLEERFQKGYEVSPDGCWIWQGYLNAHGYAETNADSRRYLLHRYAYETVHGPIPDGLTIDHLCHTEDTSCPGGVECVHRACVNPDHLEAVTRAENVRRGRHKERAARTRESITHCPHGHEYTPENSFYARDGRRSCRECMRARTQRATEKAREERHRAS